MRIILLGVLVLTLSGCATVNYEWTKPGVTAEGRNRDKAQCAYEAAAATSVTTGATARSTGGAVAQGMFEGIAEVSRRRELERLCMTARGYTQ